MICIISDIYIISGKIISNSFKIQYKRVQFNSVTTAAGTYIKKKKFTSENTIFLSIRFDLIISLGTY